MLEGEANVLGQPQVPRGVRVEPVTKEELGVARHAGEKVRHEGDLLLGGEPDEDLLETMGPVGVTTGRETNADQQQPGARGATLHEDPAQPGLDVFEG